MEPATLAELKSTFPNSSAEWRESQLEAKSTLSDAAIAYATHVEAKAKADREAMQKQLDEAKAIKPKSIGHSPLTAANVADDLESHGTIDPISDFDAAVRSRLPKHREASFTERQEAIAFIARTNPKLHRSYIEATNAGNGPKVSRLITEKYDAIAAAK